MDGLHSCALMLRHLRHIAILAALVLLLQLLVIHSLLLLFLSHVTAMGCRSWHASSGRRHRWNIIRGGDIISSIDTVLIARGLWSVQASLVTCQREW